MKVKLIMTFLVSGLISSLMAVITSEEILCRIQVNSVARSTVLSLSLTELGAPDGDVSLDKLVLTDNLEDGTILFTRVKDSTYAWRLQKGAWQSITTVDGNLTADSVGVNSLSRGVAFWVERAGDQEALNKPFYIYGKVGERLSGRQNIIAGVPGVDSLGQDVVIPAYTRLGNPNPEDLAINDLKWAGVGKNDELAFGATNKMGFAVYTYNTAVQKWGLRETYKQGKVLKTRWNYDIILPAGEGFWYVRKELTPTSVIFGSDEK